MGITARRSLAIGLLAIIFVTMTACMETKEEISEEVTKQLESKYKIEFEITDIIEQKGDNKVLFKPITNNTIHATASIDKNNKLISDDFVSRKIANDINDIVLKRLEAQKVEGYSEIGGRKYKYENVDILKELEKETSVSDIVDIDIVNSAFLTIQKYTELYKPEYFSGTIIVKDNGRIIPEMFIGMLDEIYTVVGHRHIQANVYVIDKEDYSSAIKKYKKELNVTKEWFKDNKIKVTKRMELYTDEDGFHKHSIE